MAAVHRSFVDSAYKNAYAAQIGLCVGIISRKAVMRRNAISFLRR